jgi:hypothetical protein
VGKALGAFWPGRDTWGREPASCAGGREQLRGAAGFSACPDWACGYPKCNVVMLLRTSENTGVVQSSVSSGVFTRVLWERWVGEKQKRASDAAGASGGGGQRRKLMTTCFAPRSPKDPTLQYREVLTLDHPHNFLAVERLSLFFVFLKRADVLPYTFVSGHASSKRPVLSLSGTRSHPDSSCHSPAESLREPVIGQDFTPARGRES